MADAPKILDTDFLDEAYPKLNKSIDNANEALRKSTSAETNSAVAVNKANTAESKANSVQEQFNQVVIEGDSSVEAAQARVDAQGNSFSTLQERLNTSDVQLVENAVRVGENRLSNTNKNKKPLVSFICDDGASSDLTKLLPIIQEKNFPIAIAVITDWVGQFQMNTQFMTWEEIKQFADAGCEIISHTTQQQHLTQLTDAELDSALGDAREVLRQHGYYSDLIAYPYGENDERVRRYTRKYYRAGFGIRGDTGVYGSNAAELFQFNIARIGLGSSYDPATAGFPSDTTSLEYYKSRVDEAVANNSWVVFMLHTSGVLDATQQQHLRDLVDYIRGLSIPILNPSEALQEVGNLIDIGEKTSQYLKINARGEIKTNMNDFQLTKYTEINKYDFSTYINSFPYGITLTPISTAKAQSSPSAPVGVGGTLATYRVSSSQDFNYQVYTTVTGKRYIRNCQADGTFTGWFSNNKSNIQITIQSITVPANSTLNHVYSNTSIKNTDVLVAYPTSNIENGLIYSPAFVVNNKDVVIRFVNMTGVAITTIERVWNINLIQ